MIRQIKPELDTINMFTYEIEKELSKDTVGDLQLERAIKHLKEIMVISKSMIRELNH